MKNSIPSTEETIVKQTTTISFSPEERGEQGRLAILQYFNEQDIQHLGESELVFAQQLAGHGNLYGHWQTDENLSLTILQKAERNINIEKRIKSYLRKISDIKKWSKEQINEGVITVSRIALLLRLVTFTGKGRSPTKMKPSTISRLIYRSWPKIVSRAIASKAQQNDLTGFLACLTSDDIRVLSQNVHDAREVKRLHELLGMGLWTDTPPLPDITLTTDPSGDRTQKSPEKKSVPHPPIPDDYMSEIGPRVLWLVEELGPNLLYLLNALSDYVRTLESMEIEKGNGKRINDFIASNLIIHPWLNQVGKPLSPPFPLNVGRGKSRAVEEQDWPPRNWNHIVNLSILLQGAHLFIALLASAGRRGEVRNLTRASIQINRSGKDVLRGFTYKLSGSLFGDERQWPVPEGLRQALGQQVRLAEIWGWLPKSILDKSPDEPRFGNKLWVSLGIPHSAGTEDAIVNVDEALENLTERVGMDPRPGGKKLHPHRFRKTIGRLAGVALWNSPLVLKRLFGHKSIEMTLHYILSDPGVREEVDKVLRELRIMHCSDALEDIHQAIKNNLPMPEIGGAGAARLEMAVRNENNRLHEKARLWDKGSAYDLASLLTVQGQSWRLVKENIICSKTQGDEAPCQKKRKKGEPDTSNCHADCGNRIVFMTDRRDTERKIDSYLSMAHEAREGSQLLVMASLMENLKDELEIFPDLKAKYLADGEVQSLFALCEDPEQEEATA